MPAALALAACRAPEAGPRPGPAEQPGASRRRPERLPRRRPERERRSIRSPLQDLAPEEILDLRTPWSGDMDPLGSSHRRFIRVVVPVSRTLYFNDGPEQQGIAYDALREFERMLAARSRPGGGARRRS